MFLSNGRVCIKERGTITPIDHIISIEYTQLDGSFKNKQFILFDRNHILFKWDTLTNKKKRNCSYPTEFNRPPFEKKVHIFACLLSYEDTWMFVFISSRQKQNEKKNHRFNLFLFKLEKTTLTRAPSFRWPLKLR